MARADLDMEPSLEARNRASFAFARLIDQVTKDPDYFGSRDYKADLKAVEERLGTVNDEYHG